MIIELIIHGKTAKIWLAEYRFGPEPITAEVMSRKQLELDNKILECKVDAGPLIYNSNYEMYVTVKSKLNPADISKDEFEEFVLQVAVIKAKNKNPNGSQS